MNTDGLPQYVTEIIQLPPRAVVVVRVKSLITAETAELIRSHVAAMLPDDARVLVMDELADLKVLAP